MRKRLLVVALSAVMAVSMAFPVFAGTWTHKDKDGYNWSYLDFYIKDNGKHASKEWINDNGTWYWIPEDGYISGAGISSDGYLFNKKGQYVDMSDGSRRFLTKDTYSQLQIGMSFEQVKSIIGEPHEYDDTMSSTYMIQQTEHHIDYYYYYTNNPKNYADICISDGELQNFWAYWDNK